MAKAKPKKKATPKKTAPKEKTQAELFEEQPDDTEPEDAPAGDNLPATTTADPNLPEAFQGLDDTGYEGLDADSLMIPRLKVVQPTSQEGNPGFFRSNLTGEEYPEMTIIVLRCQQSRVMYDPDPKSDREEPLCRSYDFIIPDVSAISDIEDPYNPVCAERIQISAHKSKLEIRCPKARWINRQRPDCDEVWNLLCLDEAGVPFWFSSSGASIRAVKAFISSIALRRMRLYQFLTTMTLDERKQPHRHYALKMSPPKPIPDEMAQGIADMVMAMRDVGIKPVVETPAEDQDEDPGEDQSWMTEKAE